MKRPRIPATVMRILPLLGVAVLNWLTLPNTRNNEIDFLIQQGKPWPYEEVTAEFDFPIYKSDEQLAQDQQEAMRSFTPYFTPIDDTNQSMLIVSAEDMEMLHREGYTQLAITNQQHTAQTVDLSDVYTPKSAYQLTEQEHRPNLIYDSITSNRLRDNILSSVSLTQGMVQTGERIIDQGELVTAQTCQMLHSYVLAREERNVDQHQAHLMALFYHVGVLVILGMFVLYLLMFRPRLWKTKNMLFFSLLMTMIIISSHLCLGADNPSMIYLIPFAWVPIITRVFFDSRTAFALHLTTCLLVAMAYASPFSFVVIQVSIGLISIASLKDISQRAQLARTAVWVLLAYAAIYTISLLSSTGNPALIDWHVYIWMLINAALIICSYGVIYLFEKMFKLVSSITLLELANINSDLMHEFAEKAPGTFQHSLSVSNLATEAAKCINANVMLVRTGALYHDIGKMSAPLNFTENQGGGNNPLMTLSNSEAAHQVIAHVSEGQRIARAHHLPEVIIQFISTHHGDSLTRYFYNSEVNRVGQEAVNEADFRYPGPRPMSKEGAIVMMADAVEARSRSLQEYTEESIGQMVDDMINMQISSGQFSETKLSFRDVETIRRVFRERLILMNHHRIQYPDIK